jgi:hypothetical protein
MAYAESENCDEAVAWQERVLEAMPEDPDSPSPQRTTMSNLLEHYKTTRPCRYP